MATLIPALPRGRYDFEFVSNFTDQSPPLGGETQRISKLGDRFSVSTECTLRGDQGVAVIALLNANRGARVRLPIPQSIAVGSPGSPLVDGSHAGGTSLDIKGLAAGYPLRGGQFISIVKSGRRYLHQVVQPVTADGSGDASVAIVPMLRVSLAGNEVIEIDDVTVEGFLDGPKTEWSKLSMDLITVKITVREAE